MQTYISILRGINVGGNRVIKMDQLRRMYEILGLTDCQTFIQSGNVIFKSQIEDPIELAKNLSDEIFECFKLNVPVIVLTAKELNLILAKNPFCEDHSKDSKYLHVTLLSSLPSSESYQKLLEKSYFPEEFAPIGKSIYLYCPNGYGNSKLTNGFFENKLGVTATTRNWKTLNELMCLATKNE